MLKTSLVSPHPMIDTILHSIVTYVAQFGYAGIFIMMFLESTFFPLPSEIVLIPAGYLAYQGEMDAGLVILYGTLGSIGGALFNYYLAKWLGRAFLLKYGKYMLIKEKTIINIEEFFKTHGSISTFSGRLIPVVRHYISIPAGIAQMNMTKFIAYTALGAGIWAAVLTILGYAIGHNQALLKEYLDHIIIATLVAVAVIVAVYVWLHRRKRV
jgi:membrane protein DedA with SNARE-associated domain